MRLIPNIEALASFSVAFVMLCSIYISSALSGQTHSNDPNACRGPQYSDVNPVYLCCDGYTKDAEANLTAYCRECPDGTYGENCRGKCTCDNGSTCNKVDGVCLCPHGYYGGQCEFSCNCINDSTCNMLDGSCICPSGRHGSVCQNICNCPMDTTCDGKTGKCKCLEGFYGSPPSTTCKRCNCTENAKCDPSEGCVCKSGYYGPRCDKECQCYNGASCSTVDPDECECVRGWAGRSCEQCDSNTFKVNDRPYCEDKCFKCFNGHECKPSEGNCFCLPGWHGNWCDRTCDEGYYGENCTSKVSLFERR
ncbi:multiple epidermal growth factor-like domains protein 10 [Ptychodera flava]|uniref:multiple epidermal growth factor-like domains protein 10 n=1 Tax=Ptychodera flava TaxID=63121 RepID=UPI00396A7D90